MNNKIRRTAVAGVLSFSLLAAACGSDDSSGSPETTAAAATTEAPAPESTMAAETTMAPDEGAELASGEVFVTGSSTVEPISVRVSELADSLTGGGLAVTVEGPGTGDGFQLFCGGEADVTGASRAIKEEEAQACADAGVNFVELQVAIDGLTVATSPSNTAVECLDTAALYALIGPESEGFANWSDANALATELGSKHVPLPDAPLVITGPGEESGTYDSFVEFAIKDIAKEREQDDATRADYTSSANDNLIVEGIEGSDSSLGWVGYSYFQAEGDRVKAIAIENEEGACVVPTDETIADGSYPFSRKLFVYVNVDNAASNPAVKSFIDLYLSDEGIATVVDAGYVPETAEQLQAARDAWAAAVS